MSHRIQLKRGTYHSGHRENIDDVVHGDIPAKKLLPACSH